MKKGKNTKIKIVLTALAVICVMLLVLCGCETTPKKTTGPDEMKLISEYYGFKDGEEKPTIIWDKSYADGTHKVKILWNKREYTVSNGTWYKEEIINGIDIIETGVSDKNDAAEYEVIIDKSIDADAIDISAIDYEKVRNAVEEEVKNTSVSGTVLYKGCIIDTLTVMINTNNELIVRVSARLFVLDMTDDGPRQTVTVMYVRVPIPEAIKEIELPFIAEGYSLTDKDVERINVGDTVIYDSAYRLFKYEAETMLEYYSQRSPELDWYKDYDIDYEFEMQVVRNEALYQDAVRNGFLFNAAEAFKGYNILAENAKHILPRVREDGLTVIGLMKENAIQKLGISEETYIGYQIMLFGKNMAVAERLIAFTEEYMKNGATAEEANEAYNAYCEKICSELIHKAEGKASEGLAYTVNEDGVTCTITGIGTCTDTVINIPEIYDGYTVTAIGDSAFRDYRDILSFSLPDTVTSIGPRAFFSCIGLKEFTVPDSVKEIKDRAFHGCIFMETFNMGDGVTTLGKEALSGCHSLTKINWGTGLKTIGREAFEECDHLETLVIPDGVEKIGDLAFSACLGLETVELSDSVKTVSQGAFTMCKRLREVTLGSGLTDMKSNAFEGCVGISKVICHGTYEQFEKLLDGMFVTTHEFVFTEDRQEDQE